MVTQSEATGLQGENLADGISRNKRTTRNGPSDLPMVPPPSTGICGCLWHRIPLKGTFGILLSGEWRRYPVPGQKSGQRMLKQAWLIDTIESLIFLPQGQVRTHK